MLQVSNIYALRMAGVLLISLATMWLRTGVMPRWLAFVTYAVALVLLVVTTLSLWVTLIFPAWVLGVSILILVQNYRRRAHRVIQFSPNRSSGWVRRHHALGGSMSAARARVVLVASSGPLNRQRADIRALLARVARARRSVVTVPAPPFQRMTLASPSVTIATSSPHPS